MCSGSDVRALISETHLAEVNTTKKVTFQERSNREHNASGSKGGPVSFDRIRFKSHGRDQFVSLRVKSLQLLKKKNGHLVKEN